MREHFVKAIDEVKPAFGVAEDDLLPLVKQPLIMYDDNFSALMSKFTSMVTKMRDSNASLFSILIDGKDGVGKTAIAAHLAMNSGFHYIKMVSPENFVGTSEQHKCTEISKIFADALKSPLSLVLLDNVERLLEYVPIGPRFSNAVLQTLSVLIKKQPKRENRKLFVIATTSSASILHDLSLSETFQVRFSVPEIQTLPQVMSVLKSTQLEFDTKSMQRALQSASHPITPIGIKQLLLAIEMSKSGSSLSIESLLDSLESIALNRGGF